MVPPTRKKVYPKKRRLPPMTKTYVYNINNDITALADMNSKFVLGASVLIKQHDLFLARVNIYFPTANVTYIKAQIQLNHMPILPDTSIQDSNKSKSDGFTVVNYIKASDIPFIADINQELNKGDKLQVWYMNSKNSDLDFQVLYEIERIRKQ